MDDSKINALYHRPAEGVRPVEDVLRELLAMPFPVPPQPGAEPIPPLRDLENRITSLDAVAAENSATKTQDQWIAYWSAITDGRTFASMPEYYQAFKDLKEKSEHGSAEEKELAQRVVASLREDFTRSWLISSTRTIYLPTGENAQIIHHYGCRDNSLIQTFYLPIPVYLDEIISTVLDDQKGLTYLQTIIGTRDDPEEIMQILEFLSGKQRNGIKIWTPPIKEKTGYITRKELLMRASGFYYYGGGFHMYDNGILYYGGRTRGVSSNPR